MDTLQVKYLRLSLLLFALSLSTGSASEWTHWRGPYQTGVSPETNLISDWSLDGNHLIWKADFIGRSTPVVLNGRVYVVGRTGEGIKMQRHVACYDAQTGKLVWEDKNNVFHTTVPFTRVGWSSLAGDPETGNVYLFGVEGLFVCYDKDGNRLWEHSMEEEYNRFSGYGGRTATPVVDEDLVIINMNYHTWGNMMIPRHRFLAFDKKSGELVWNFASDAPPKNTNYSVPVVAMINGVRTLVCGGADGALYALQARTGKKIWKYELTKGAVQTSVVVDGNRIYAAHGDENIHNATIGSVVCIDGVGSGDLTESNEIWRVDGLEVGYASPLFHDGRLYVITNQGDLVALDGDSGEQLWKINLGTVGKGSPVWADGKIFATEVNGSFHIIRPGENEAKFLDKKNIRIEGQDRFAEIYGSPAIAYGRVYFTSEVGLYCLGDENARFEAKSSNSVGMLNEQKPDENAQVAHIQIVPAETWIYTNQPVQFKVRTYDEQGRKLGEGEAQFTLAGLQGQIDAQGRFTPEKSAGNQAGYVTSKIGDLESQARVQVSSGLPFSEDFSTYAVDKNIPLWPGAWKFFVKEVEGEKVLNKPPSARNLNRHNLYLGPPDMNNYTIQADVKGTKVKRRSPDMGVIANRYYLDFMTKKQRLQVRTWPAELRMMKEIDFAWQPDVWYTMKLRIDIVDGKGIIKGKVWPRDEQEPDAWTITAEDPIPNTHGSPGLYGDAATDIYYDNVNITESE